MAYAQTGIEQQMMQMSAICRKYAVASAKATEYET